MSLNHVCVMGRMTKDPELRHTNSGTPVVSFTLAVERDFKDKKTGEKGTDFLEVVAWRNTAEFIEKYMGKGRMIVADGKLQSRKYEDKDGNKRTAVEIVADSVYFADSKRNDGQANNEAQFPANAESGFEELVDEEDDTLPF